MKTIIITILCLNFCFGQERKTLENQVTQFSLIQENDTIEFIIADTLLNKSKPVFLWCQGSFPVPLFAEIEDYGLFFIGGGVSNFDYKEISKEFHLVVISMPKTPILAKKENLNDGFQYIPNPDRPNEYLSEFHKANHLENYVKRGEIVLNFLKKQSWVNNDRLVIAGHSQGTKVASKIALRNEGVTHLGLFAPNPLGRIDQIVREARLDAQLGKISWEKADSIMNENYEFYKKVQNIDSLKANPSLKAWKSFSEAFYDDWLKLEIPIYLTYGTEDRTSDLCDIVPFFFIEKGKDNLTLNRLIGLNHNFFELNNAGRANHEKGHWEEVMNNFVEWIKN